MGDTCEEAGLETWRYKRNRWLVAHGYVDEHGWSDYSAYTRSRHWREFRRTYFERHPAQCSVCLRTGLRLILHHLTYKRIGRGFDRDVTPLCKRCHDLVHDKLSTGRYIYKGYLEMLRKIFLEEGERRLEELHDAYIARRRPTAKRKRGRSHRSGRVLVRQISSLTPEERAKYGV